MKCVQCGIEHYRKSQYCSKRCTDKSYRERNKLKLVESKEDPIEIPEDKGPKLKWCNYCGSPIHNSRRKGFCDSDHEKEYLRCVNNQLPLKIRIDAKTVVETKRYDKVQDIIEAMIARNKLGVTFF